MSCNPEQGDLRQISENFPMEEAIRKGYTEIFQIGEIIRIKNCYFSVNNFVESHGFMNLKLMKNSVALEALSQILSRGESIGTINEIPPA